MPTPLTIHKSCATLALIGFLYAPTILAFSPAAHVPKFAAAAVTPCQAFVPRPVPELPGRLQTGCTTLEHLVQQAFGLFAGGHLNPLFSATVDGGPSWLKSDFYQIDAIAPGQTHAMMNGPMLQALLEDRFQLRAYRETEQVPVYSLTAVKNALRLLSPFPGMCISWDSDDSPAHRDPEQMCASPLNITPAAFDLHAATIEDLCLFLSLTLDRPVLDRTGITGRFVFHLEVPTEDIRRQTRGISAYRNPNVRVPPASPAFISAAKAAVKKLGLSLDPTNGPRPFIVIESISRP